MTLLIMDVGQFARPLPHQTSKGAGAAHRTARVGEVRPRDGPPSGALLRLDFIRGMATVWYPFWQNTAIGVAQPVPTDSGRRGRGRHGRKSLRNRQVRLLDNAKTVVSERVGSVIQFSGDEPMYTVSDGSKLYRVLHNLIHNRRGSVQGGARIRERMNGTPRDHRHVQGAHHKVSRLPVAHAPPMTMRENATQSRLRRCWHDWSYFVPTHMHIPIDWRCPFR